MRREEVKTRRKTSGRCRIVNLMRFLNGSGQLKLIFPVSQLLQSDLGIKSKGQIWDNRTIRVNDEKFQEFLHNINEVDQYR